MVKRLIIVLGLLVLLLIGVVASAWWWLTTTRSGAQWALSQAGRFVDTLEWSRLEGGLAGGVVAHDLRLRAAGVSFDAARVELAVRVRPLPRRAVRIYWLRGYDMELVLPEPDEDAPEPEPFVLPEDLSSPVPVHLDELRLQNLSIQFAGSEDPLIIDHLELAARLDQRLKVEDLQLRALDWALEGDIDAGLQQPWQAQARLAASGELAQQSLRAELDAQLADEALSLQLTSDGLIRAHAQGSIADVFAQPVLDLEVTSDHLAWPEIPATISDLAMRVNGQPQQWQAVADFDAELALAMGEETTLIPGRLHLQARGDLQHVVLEQSRIGVLDGRIEADGSLRWDTLAAQANIAFEQLDFTALYPDWPQQAPVSGRMAGTYGENVIEIEALELRAPPSSLSLSGSGRIDAATDTVAADIGWQNLSWPPVTSADHPPLFESAQGRLQADGRLSDWRAELQAQLKAQAVPAEARLEATLSGDRTVIAVEDLDLRAGDNRLRVSGATDRDFEYRLVAADLRQLWPDLTGQLNLAGRIDPATLGWTVSGQGENLTWQTIRLDALELESRGSLAAGASRLDTRLVLRTLDLSPWERIARVELTTEGTCEEHRIELQVDADSADLRLAGQGGMDACPPGFEAWQAQWARLDLMDTVAGDWALSAPAGSRIDNAGDLQLSDWCLEPADSGSESGDGRLCVLRLESGGEGGSAEVTLARIPANLLLALSDSPVRLSSLLDGAFSAAWTGGGLQTLDGRLDVGRGWLRQQGAAAGLQIETGTVEVHDAGSGDLRAGLVVEVEGDSRIEADLQLLQWQHTDAARLSGTAAVQVPDLSAYARLVPELDRLEGSVRGNFNLAGALTSPALDGQLEVRDGHVESIPLGLRLTAIVLDAQTANSGLSLTGGFTAGDGRAELSGHAAPGDDGGWQVDARVRGQDLQLFQADWLRLSISPDFSLDLSGERIVIDGRIDIPHARLGLPPGSDERVAVSGDVVVVGAPETEEPTAPAIPLAGSLTIGLGHDVRFQAAGAQADLTGEVELSWRNGAPMPRGRGTVFLTGGHYQAYGQNLVFTRSEVQFAARPVDDPNLDIRAVREIFADPVVEAAGVHIRGTARNPVIELFTDPPTSQEKALAYIVTGADFDHAAGQGAFNIGFYLLPKLFVSYGIGLFETGNVLSASYRLSRRWGLRASSGERDTGADFLYTIDR